jgi:prevent-host-death family protein
MIRPSDIHSVSTFTRNAKELIAKTKRTQSPLTITINGEPEVIVMDIHTYEQIAEFYEHQRIALAIEKAELELEQGMANHADAVFERLFKKYNAKD